MAASLIFSRSFFRAVIGGVVHCNRWNYDRKVERWRCTVVRNLFDQVRDVKKKKAGSHDRYQRNDNIITRLSMTTTTTTTIENWTNVRYFIIDSATWFRWVSRVFFFVAITFSFFQIFISSFYFFRAVELWARGRASTTCSLHTSSIIWTRVTRCVRAAEENTPRDSRTAAAAAEVAPERSANAVAVEQRISV